MAQAVSAPAPTTAAPIQSAGVSPVRLRLASTSRAPIFVGVGPAEPIKGYLSGTSYTTVGNRTRTEHDGAPPAIPSAKTIDWTARAVGPGVQTLRWNATEHPQISHRGGMVNTVHPEPTVPSHQGPDAQTVLHDLDIVTIAAAGPFNLSHMHFAIIEAPGPAERAAVIEALEDAPRIVLVRAKDGIEAPNSVIEVARDIGRTRNDVWEVPVWENSVVTTGCDPRDNGIRTRPRRVDRTHQRDARATARVARATRARLSRKEALRRRAAIE